MIAFHALFDHNRDRGRIGQNAFRLMAGATGFFEAPPNTDAQLICRKLVTAILSSLKNENTGYFVSRRPSNTGRGRICSWNVFLGFVICVSSVLDPVAN
jgi:hypothetical protein